MLKIGLGISPCINIAGSGGTPPPTPAPTLTWTSGTATRDPVFTISPIAEADSVFIQVATDAGFVSVYSSDTHVVTLAEAVSGTFSFSGLSTLGYGTLYYARVSINGGTYSNTVSKTMDAAPTNISLVSSASKAYTSISSGATTAAISTTGANFIVLSVSGDGSTAWTVSDSKGNTWTAATLFDAPSQSPSIRNYYCIGPVVGSGHTFTVSGANAGANLTATAWANVKQTTPLEAQVSTNTATFGTLTSGAVVPAANGDLLLAVLGAFPNGNIVSSTPAGFTAINEDFGSAGNAYGLTVMYLVQAVAASQNSTWVSGQGTPAVVSLTAFKQA